MIDILIILAVIALMLLAARASFKHFKGEGSCCGGSCHTCSACAGEKKLPYPVTDHTVLHIDGMHCAHCVQSVTHALNQIDGVSARVDLRTGTAQIACDRSVDEAALTRAVEQAGFHVTSIEH